MHGARKNTLQSSDCQPNIYYYRTENKYQTISNEAINEQLAELKQLSPQMDNEQEAILMAVNALSDQLKKQERILELEEETAELKKKMIKFTELENRVKRMEQSRMKLEKY